VTLTIRGFDPLKLGERLEKLVARNCSRKYYRFRPSRFYGGSAVGDVVGCNLRCLFCWSGRARDDPTVGFWVSANEAYRRLASIARKKGYKYIRLSGGEPTIGWKHLLCLLDLVEADGKYLFILETNGIILGADKGKACQLAKYNHLHVRLSIKACNPELFTKLTLAKPEAFKLQLLAAKHLADCNVDFHVAIFASFGDEKCWASLIEELANMAGPEIVANIEVEYLLLYPNVKRRLKILEKMGIKPRIAYQP
jgi:uncharacterized Fe-S cluster-containing radical SAM superfamily protein